MQVSQASSIVMEDGKDKKVLVTRGGFLGALPAQRVEIRLLSCLVPERDKFCCGRSMHTFLPTRIV
jgi:hypothetical protein